MRIFRRGFYSDHGNNELTKRPPQKEAQMPTTPFWDPENNEKVEILTSGRSRGSTYKYTVRLSVQEVQELLDASLTHAGLTDSEREAWKAIFALWKKTVANGG